MFVLFKRWGTSYSRRSVFYIWLGLIALYTGSTRATQRHTERCKTSKPGNIYPRNLRLEMPPRVNPEGMLFGIKNTCGPRCLKSEYLPGSVSPASFFYWWLSIQNFHVSPFLFGSDGTMSETLGTATFHTKHQLNFSKVWNIRKRRPFLEDYVQVSFVFFTLRRLQNDEMGLYLSISLCGR